MQLSKLLRDNESEPSPTMLACTAAINLAETLEQILCFHFSKAAASVNYIEFHMKLVLCCVVVLSLLSTTSHKHFTSLREFDGVSHNIQKDLADAEAISLDLIRHIVFDRVIQLKAFVDSHCRGEVVDLLNKRSNVKPVHVQSDHASLRFRKVQDIINEASKSFGTGSNDRDVL